MQAGRITQADAPHRLYEHPQTRFISSFVGKANLLAGRVQAAGEPAAVAVGQALLPAVAPQALAGEPVLLSLRPEKIRLLADGQGQLAGTVSERFFLGSQWLYKVATPAGELAVLAPNDGAAPLEEGARTGLAWPLEQVRLLAGAAEAAEGLQ
jgi:putative spermidine/putrescine transport system ATP-binding protein